MGGYLIVGLVLAVAFIVLSVKFDPVMKADLDFDAFGYLMLGIVFFVILIGWPLVIIVGVIAFVFAGIPYLIIKFLKGD